jgi:hypothetical protein
MSQSPLSEKELKKRKERFRYTDLSHPLIQVLFHMSLPVRKKTEQDL